MRVENVRPEVLVDAPSSEAVEEQGHFERILLFATCDGKGQNLCNAGERREEISVGLFKRAGND
jgi:hypothetical protein